MKHLLTAIACLLAVAGSAQTWNPDADFDNVIGTSDLLALLTVFGSEWTAEYPQEAEYDVAAYLAGKDLDRFECYNACRSNNARIVSWEEVAIFKDSIFSVLYTDFCEDNSDDDCFNPPCSWNLSGEDPYRFPVLDRGRLSLWQHSCNITCAGGELINTTSMGGNVAPESWVTQGFSSNGEFYCFCAGLVPVVE
ncbi:hypothetical protein OAF30_03325 [Flavobacteriales bacterium]|nr:hypothetical protein [Flavobacteriales bacterium]